MIDSDENTNYALFKDCISGSIITQCALPPTPTTRRRRSGKGKNKGSGSLDSIEEAAPSPQHETDAAELAELLDVGYPLFLEPTSLSLIPAHSTSRRRFSQHSLFPSGNLITLHLHQPPLYKPPTPSH